MAFVTCVMPKTHPLTITDSIYGILTGGNVAERIAGFNRIEGGNEDVISQLEKLLVQLKAGS